MHKASFPYEDHGTPLEGFVCYPSKEKRPLVLLCHSWSGKDHFMEEQAERMASWGYVGFALDLYGKGVLGKTWEECRKLKEPFCQDRTLVRRRVVKALELASQLPYVDAKQVATIGFGFGGLCALDLARTGAPLKGVVTFYGHFEPPAHLVTKPIKAKILALHGRNDPIEPPEELLASMKEWEEAKVDCQAHFYSNTMHSFVNPAAIQAPKLGTAYNALSAKRAWQATHHFLQELFSPS